MAAGSASSCRIHPSEPFRRLGASEKSGPGPISGCSRGRQKEAGNEAVRHGYHRRRDARGDPDLAAHERCRQIRPALPLRSTRSCWPKRRPLPKPNRSTANTLLRPSHFCARKAPNISMETVPLRWSSGFLDGSGLRCRSDSRSGQSRQPLPLLSLHRYGLRHRRSPGRPFFEVRSGKVPIREIKFAT
jgi:hypothetical protein